MCASATCSCSSVKPAFAASVAVLVRMGTRDTVASVTGLTLTVVDDRLGVLVDEGELIRAQRGIYMPAQKFPAARPMSKTIMPGGMVKIESATMCSR